MSNKENRNMLQADACLSIEGISKKMNVGGWRQQFM